VVTAKQIEYKLTQAKKKLANLNKEVTDAKAAVKKLDSEFKKARMILIAKAAEKMKVKKKTVSKKSAVKKKAGKKAA